MPIVYRSPDIPIDEHEWHVVVQRHYPSGGVSTVFRWRPIGKFQEYRPITSWLGRLPKGLRAFFQPYQKSIRVARGEVPAGTQKRRAA